MDGASIRHPFQLHTSRSHLPLQDFSTPNLLHYIRARLSLNILSWIRCSQERSLHGTITSASSMYPYRLKPFTPILDPYPYRSQPFKLVLDAYL